MATENVAVSGQHGVTGNNTSGYEFWFFDPNGNFYSFRRFRPTTLP
ncbi:MAG: hypothetical protein IPJ10_16350 [Flavobacteriales bacterium]|nr:hypothetical protein [Flavobacteriales bacterium]